MPTYLGSPGDLESMTPAGPVTGAARLSGICRRQPKRHGGGGGGGRRGGRRIRVAKKKRNAIPTPTLHETLKQERWKGVVAQHRWFVAAPSSPHARRIIRLSSNIPGGGGCPCSTSSRLLAERSPSSTNTRWGAGSLLVKLFAIGAGWEQLARLDRDAPRALWPPAAARE